MHWDTTGAHGRGSSENHRCAGLLSRRHHTRCRACCAHIRTGCTHSSAWRAQGGTRACVRVPHAQAAVSRARRQQRAVRREHRLRRRRRVARQHVRRPARRHVPQLHAAALGGDRRQRAVRRQRARHRLRAGQGWLLRCVRALLTCSFCPSRGDRHPARPHHCRHICNSSVLLSAARAAGGLGAGTERPHNPKPFLGSSNGCSHGAVSANLPTSRLPWQPARRC